MEPIPYFYDSVNRSAILVKPKKPWYDWINHIYEDSPTAERKEGTIYLLGELDELDDIERWMRVNFDHIFQNELNDWHTAELDWPQNRTYKMFNEWFSYEIHCSILDLEDDEIRKI